MQASLKRFYEKVEVATDDARHFVSLDGRRLRRISKRLNDAGPGAFVDVHGQDPHVAQGTDTSGGWIRRFAPAAPTTGSPPLHW